jgi:hypothetical protein
MAVDRKGIAYSVFNDGSLFKIHTANGACEATPYVPNQAGFSTFGMGFSTDLGGPSETLYVAATGFQGGESKLGIIDPVSYKLTPVGLIDPQLPGMELTGTGDGRLFGFVADPVGSGTRLVRVNKQTAEAALAANLPELELGNGWAFAFWGGDFYFFTELGGTSIVTRFDPIDGSSTTVAGWQGLIVGAGVSTCAPEQ